MEEQKLSNFYCPVNWFHSNFVNEVTERQKEIRPYLIVMCAMTRRIQRPLADYYRTTRSADIAKNVRRSRMYLRNRKSGHLRTGVVSQKRLVKNIMKLRKTPVVFFKTKYIKYLLVD